MTNRPDKMCLYELVTNIHTSSKCSPVLGGATLLPYIYMIPTLRSFVCFRENDDCASMSISLDIAARIGDI
jgi:hypothetical protein